MAFWYNLFFAGDFVTISLLLLGPFFFHFYLFLIFFPTFRVRGVHMQVYYMGKLCITQTWVTNEPITQVVTIVPHM